MRCLLELEKSPLAKAKKSVTEITLVAFVTSSSRRVY